MDIGEALAAAVKIAVVTHILMAVFVSLLLCTPAVAILGSIYCLSVTACGLVSLSIRKLTGKMPRVGRLQLLLIVLLPFYGLPLFLVIFHVVQGLRFPE